MSGLLSASRRWAGITRGISLFSLKRYSSVDFFNRNKEIKVINQILTDPPSISVFTGPPDSGKSTLLNHVLCHHSVNRPIVSIDLREDSFSDVNSFLTSMEEKLITWSKAIKEFGKNSLPEHIGINILDFGVNVDLPKIYKNTKDEDPNIKLKKFYKRLMANLPKYSIWSGLNFPILFIDEANEMMKLPRSGIDGELALHNLFKFLIKCTKQERRFNVLLASSDSFYSQWLSTHIRSNHFETYVIGDLSKEEAAKYWEEQIVRKSPGYNFPSFEEAFFVCGTSMYILQKYANESRRMPKMKPMDFSIVEQNKFVLSKALAREDAPWSREELLSVMKKLCESENGYILYKTLCDEIGKSVVDKIIEANLIHMRPTTRLSFDLVNAPAGAILTAESRPAALSMKMIIEEEEQ